MGIFNEHSNNQPQSQQGFLKGLQGAPDVGFNLTKDGNYDMLNKKLKNVGEGVETTDAITKHQLEVSLNSKLGKTSLTNYVKKNSPKVSADLDMKGFAIKNMKVTPGNDSSATSRKYVDRKIDTKADKNDLNDYLKLDGTSQMQGDLKMNNKRITGLPTSTPNSGDEATSKDYVLSLINTQPSNLYLKLDGTSQMSGNLQMNNYPITALKSPTSNGEAANKKYVDENIIKANIKPSHSKKRVSISHG